MKMENGSCRMCSISETKRKSSAWNTVLPFCPLEKFDELFSCFGFHFREGFGVGGVNGKQMNFRIFIRPLIESENPISPFFKNRFFVVECQVLWTKRTAPIVNNFGHDSPLLVYARIVYVDEFF